MASFQLPGNPACKLRPAARHPHVGAAHAKPRQVVGRRGGRGGGDDEPLQGRLHQAGHGGWGTLGLTEVVGCMCCVYDESDELVRWLVLANDGYGKQWWVKTRLRWLIAFQNVIVSYFIKDCILAYPKNWQCVFLLPKMISVYTVSMAAWGASDSPT